MPDPQDELDREMEKLKAMGVTVTVNLARGQAFEPDRPLSLIQKAARRAGIEGCSNRRCSLTKAHAGPCRDSSAEPKGDDS